MRTNALTLSLIALAWMAGAAAAPAPHLSVKARFDPDHTLPGLPVAVLVTATNRATEPRALPDKFIVEVHSEGGAAFIASGGLSDSYFVAIPEPYPKPLWIAPGATKELYIPLGETAASPGLLVDKGLRRPGSYGVRLVFDEEFRTHPVRMADGGFDRSWGSTWFQSDEVLLRIEEPRGLDAAFLERLREEHGAQILGDLSLADQVRFANAHWEEFRESRYGPHLMLMRRTKTTAEARDLMRRVLAMNPEPMLADRLRVSLAEVERQLAIEAEADGDHGAAIKHEEAALTLAAEAASEAQTPLGRLRADRLEREIRESAQ